MVVSGWGNRESWDNTQSGIATGIKKKIVNYLISNEDCQNHYSNLTSIKLVESHLCLNETNSGDVNCRGDSGSPVMFSYRDQWQVEGINSFGPKKCGAGVVSVHTRVSNYTEWLRINMYV